MKLAAAFSASLLACGAAPAVSPQPPPAPSAPPPVAKPAAAAPAADAPAAVTYTEVEHWWVEEKMKVDPAVAKAWAAEPANAKLVLPATRHILVKVEPARKDATEAAARKRAEAALARIKRGEDFGAVARAVSDDPGSREKGGLYPGHMVEKFVEPYAAAYRSLAPGEVTKQLVRTTFGLHIIKKELVDEATIVLAYRRAQAPQLARRLAGDIAERWRPPHAEAHARQEIEAAVRATLGVDCACDEHGPRLVVVPVGKVEPKAASLCARVLATPRGESRILELADSVLVTKTGDRADVDDGVKEALDVVPEHARWGFCTPMSSHGGEVTPEQLRRMIEEMQKNRSVPSGRP